MGNMKIIGYLYENGMHYKITATGIRIPVTSKEVDEHFSNFAFNKDEESEDDKDDT